MKFNIIVAVDSENGIGVKNNIPWCEKDDLKLFSKLTRGNNNNNCVIMGNNTWKSLPNKPLKNRDNLILSRNYQNDCNCNYFSTIESLVNFCNYKNYDEMWVIGGSEIYNLFLEKEMVKKIFLSRLNKSYKCDKFFPKIPNTFKLTEKEYINERIILETYYNLY